MNKSLKSCVSSKLLNMYSSSSSCLGCPRSGGIVNAPYHEFDNTDTDAVKVAFEDLYQRMHGMPLREMDRIVDAVCALCREHEKAGFVEGVKVGLLLLQGFEEEN